MLYCYHITPGNAHISETDENLREVFDEKKRKLISAIKTEKLVNPDIAELADEQINKLERMAEGRAKANVGRIAFHIELSRNELYFFKSKDGWFSGRYYTELPGRLPQTTDLNMRPSSIGNLLALDIAGNAKKE